MIFFQKNKKLISIIIAFIIVALVIILPVYFLVIKKSSSPDATLNSDILGFCYAVTINGVKQDNQFDNKDKFLSYAIVINADNGQISFNDFQNKWVYDKTNPYYITRTITNINKNYTSDELANLGQTFQPNTYYVNKLITIFFNKNVNTGYLGPYILTTKSQCM